MWSLALIARPLGRITLAACGGIALLQLAGTDAARAADPHACYRAVHVPAVTRTVHDRVLVSPSRTIQTHVEPRVRTQKRRVLVRTGREKRVVHPARERVVKRRVLVSPERTLVRHVAPKYRTVARKTLVRRARTLHKPCVRHGRHAMCAVHVPAKYALVHDKVLVSPGRTVREHVPARYTTRVHREIVSPRVTEKVHVAPRYRTVEVATPVAPAYTRQTHVPAKYASVPRTVVVRPAHVRHVRTACH